jgi:K+-sensing histidine kinase KdpD
LLLFGVQAASPSIAAFAVLLLSKEVRPHFKVIFQKAHITAVIVVPVLIASITMLISYFIQGRIDVPLLLFCVGCIIESYIYSILVSTTKNVLSAMIYHFSWNLMVNLFMINPSDNGGNIIPYTLVIILETVGIIIYGLYRRNKESSSDIV